MEEQGAPGQLHRPGGHQCCQLELPPVHQGEGISGTRRPSLSWQLPQQMPCPLADSSIDECT